MSKQVNNNNGIGVFGLLGVLFVALKLLDKIDWSWWWVLSPFWIPLTLVLAFIGFALSMHLLLKK